MLEVNNYSSIAASMSNRDNSPSLNSSTDEGFLNSFIDVASQSKGAVTANSVTQVATGNGVSRPNFWAQTGKEGKKTETYEEALKDKLENAISLIDRILGRLDEQRGR